MDCRKNHTVVPSDDPLANARIYNVHTTNYDHTFTRCSKENRYRALHHLRLDES